MRRPYSIVFFTALMLWVGEGYCQQLPASTLRFENDTYDSAVKFLRDGDTDGALNLINRDPLVARFALIRLLRNPGSLKIAQTFASLFPESSPSELEVPFARFYSTLPAERQQDFLNAIETVSRAEFVVGRNNPNSDFWLNARQQAFQNLQTASEFFTGAGFKTGQAFCLRIIAQEYFNRGAASFQTADTVARQSIPIYHADGNTRGEVLALRIPAIIAFRRQQIPALREILNEALQKTRSIDDVIGEIYLLYSRGSIQLAAADQKERAWLLIENRHGVRWLQYQSLAMLLSQQKYRDIYPKMLVDETDPVLRGKAQFLLAQTDDFIQTALGLGYDLAAFVDGELPVPAAPAILFNRGFQYEINFEYTHAVSDFQRGLDLLDKTGDRSDRTSFITMRARLLNALGRAYHDSGDYPQSLERYNESLADSETLGMSFLQTDDLISLAQIQAELGERQRAEQQLRKAANIRTPGLNGALLTLAAIDLNFDEYGGAIQALEEFFRKEMNSKTTVGMLSPLPTERLRLLTMAYLRLGDLTKALEYAKAVEERPQGQEIDQGVVGMVQIEMKQYAEAEQYFKKRLEQSITEKRKTEEADAHKNLGKLYRLQKRNAEAMDHLNRAIEIYRETFQRREELETLIELGHAATIDGGTAPAKGYFQQALDLASDIQFPQGTWSAHVGLATVANAAGDTNSAIEHLKHAVDAVESVSVRLHADLYEASFIEDKVGIYDDLISLVGRSDPAEAFEYAERRRAQSFLETSQRAGVSSTSTTDADLVRRLNDVEWRLIGKQRTLIDQFSIPVKERNSEFIDALKREITNLQSDHTEAILRLQLADPAEASRRGVRRRLSADEVRRDVLKSGDALVEYVVAADRVLAFVVTPANCRFIPLRVKPGVLAQRINTLLHPFDQLRSAQTDLMHMKYDVALSYQIYSDILKPLEPYLAGSRRLIIVPDDVLNYVPFESLARAPSIGQPDPTVRYSEYKDVDWLVKRYDIVYAISASSLDRRLRQPRPASGSLIAFANPRLSGTQAASIRASLRGVRSADAPLLQSLPESEREVTSIARILRQDPRTSLRIGAQAREQDFYENGPAAAYIHFAVHSIVNDTQPYYSALVLSPDAKSDGLLQTYEISKTRLTARLVTLSACETALGKLYKGEGLLGLRRAFLQSGAESVLVTFWSIEDSTAGFMEIFYGDIAKGLSLSSALRDAKLKYLDKTIPAGSQQISLSHPFFWAPFALTSTSVN